MRVDMQRWRARACRKSGTGASVVIMLRTDLGQHGMREGLGDAQLMDEIQEGLRYLFQTKSPYTLLISGTGHAGTCHSLEARDAAPFEERNSIIFLNLYFFFKKKREGEKRR